MNAVKLFRLLLVVMLIASGMTAATAQIPDTERPQGELSARATDSDNAGFRRELKEWQVAIGATFGFLALAGAWRRLNLGRR